MIPQDLKWNELRAGNLVRCTRQDESMDYRITPEDIRTAIDHPELFQSQYRAIAITTDRLKTFGFENSLLNGSLSEWAIDCTPNGYQQPYVLGFRFNISKTDRIETYHGQFWHAVGMSGTSHDFGIMTIHKLQNVFYTLTGGKELVEEN